MFACLRVSSLFMSLLLASFSESANEESLESKRTGKMLLVTQKALLEYPRQYATINISHIFYISNKDKSEVIIIKGHPMHQEIIRF